MSKFIYVFSQEDADKLTKRGYGFCKYDERNRIWIFLNKEPESLEFSPDFQCVLSNVLTF